MATMNSSMTVGEVAKHFGVPLWKVRRLFTRGILPEPERVGQYRRILVRDLPKIKEKLMETGYLEGKNVHR